jgi:hypothetical protein
MNPRIVLDEIVVPQRRWLFITVRGRRAVWRILNAFTGNPELSWFATEDEAEAALVESKKSEAHVLGIFAETIDGHQFQGIDDIERDELLALIRGGDTQQFRERIEEMIGIEKATKLLKSLHREKVFHDTYVAVMQPS